MENSNLTKPQGLPPQSPLLAGSIQQGAIWRSVLAALTGVSVFYFEHRAGAMCIDRLQVGFRRASGHHGPRRGLVSPWQPAA